MNKGNKTGWICLIIGIVLFGAAAALAWPLLKGPGSLRSVLDEKAQLDSAEAVLTEITDSLDACTQMDSLSFANLFSEN